MTRIGAQESKSTQRYYDYVEQIRRNGTNIETRGFIQSRLTSREPSAPSTPITQTRSYVRPHSRTESRLLCRYFRTADGTPLVVKPISVPEEKVPKKQSAERE